MSLHPIFTPTAMDPADLEAVTVGRVELTQRLVDRLALAARTATRAHTLVIGPRGSGKTHLLTIATHRARQLDGVDADLAVAWIPEDALAISSYADLLVELLRQLDPGAGAAARELRRRRDHGELEQRLLGTAGSRRLVLVIENLDRVFAGIGRNGMAGFRGFVETSGDILVMATAPLLFEGVMSRDEPWFGSFDIEQLDDLTLAEGTEVVRLRATGRADTDLATFVETPAGQVRLRVIEQLAGGSPRLWHILADAVNVPTLEALLPAVEKLMDDLAPYYQQRLWELPPSEQKVIVELARSAGMQTVAELAAAVGSSQQATATALGRLSEARWVRSQKSDGGDQRKTWYELREPLLRHHLQYRESRGEPLRMIVDLLRLWYSAEERRRHLVELLAGSRAERALALTFELDRNRGMGQDTLPWSRRSLLDLLADARCWRQGVSTSAISTTPSLGAALEWVLIAATGGGAVPPAAVRAALPAHLQREVAGIAKRLASTPPEDRDVGESFDQLVKLAWSAFDAPVMILICEAWSHATDATRAGDALSYLLTTYDGPAADVLPCRLQWAERLADMGRVTQAREVARQIVEELRDVTDIDQPALIEAERSFADYCFRLNDFESAGAAYLAVLERQEAVLGPDHPHALESRWWLAVIAAQSGHPASAREQAMTLLEDYLRTVGADHLGTFLVRHELAHLTGVLGNWNGAQDQYAALEADYEKAFGPGHPRGTRAAISGALSRAAAGDVDAAKRDLSTLLDHLDHNGQSGSDVRSWAREMLLELMSIGEPGDWEQPTPPETIARLRLSLGQAEADQILTLQLLRTDHEISHVEWLTRFGEAEPWAWDLARAMDGDPESRLRLNRELRQLVPPPK